MNFFDQLRTMDPRDVGRWPLAVRGFFIALGFAVVAAFGWYMFVWNDDRPVLQKAEADELVKTVPEGIYLTQIKETGKKLEMKGVAQSSTRVSTFMRNIDSSSWMDNPQLQVVETSKDSPTGGSSFTLTSDVVGVDVDGGGETAVKKVAAK